MAVLNTEELRNFIRDKAELNTLIGVQETSDALLSVAIDDALDDWNNTPPIITRYTINNFPIKSLLKTGATIFVLRSAGIGKSRNHLTYNDGGISIEKDEKTGLYQSWIDRFEQLWEKRKSDYKMQLNLRACWGGF